jgi:acyl carrier protein
MNDTEIRSTVKDVITEVAPDADLASLDPAADLRDALDIDSMDFLNVVVGIHERLGVDVPESDYDRVRNLDALVAYVAEIMRGRDAGDGAAPPASRGSPA